MKKINDYKFLIPKSGDMRVDGVIFADEEMLNIIRKDNAQTQIINVASLPGIIGNSMAMPDIHYGYGFPIGGVAGFDMEEGIISPGGIGYDINCGVRLLKTNISCDDINKKDIDTLNNELYDNVPSGVGSTGKIKISKQEVRKVVENGANWAVNKGYGEKEDLLFIEENGCMAGADPDTMSDRALERGTRQIGTLGAGNHFLEIQEVKEIFDEQAAERYGMKTGQITIMIHTGSRGLGFQICDDYLKVMRTASSKYNIKLVDRQLACAPFKSEEGRKYFSAMKCGANYAWANRQCITQQVREVIQKVLGSEVKVEIVYDVCHNVGKVEEHNGRKLIIHRKGATRSFGPGRDEIPDKYRDIGQPVIVPGTMGTSSYVMKGTTKAMEESFGSTCHGAGRVWSRTRALKTVHGSEIIKDLESRGIAIRAKSLKTIAEEAPQAYKDISKVVEICHGAGLSEKVAKVVPLGVIKG
ncbi:RtcB family protein [Elusimicrobiota bacterium]